MGTTGSAGSADPHFLEHGVQQGQGHRISCNWIGGSYSILAEIALENIIFGSIVVILNNNKNMSK